MTKSKIKILFIDDEPDAGKLFKRIVEKEGYRVFTAKSADRGWEIYKKESPRLVFLDLVMPGTDGLTLLRKIHRVNPKQPVIILTGFGDLRSARAAMRSGAFDYVSKPLDIKAILSSIKDAIRTDA